MFTCAWHLRFEIEYDCSLNKRTLSQQRITRMGTFLYELHRRKVFRVAVIYVIASWLIMQVVDAMALALTLPEWSVHLVAVLLLVGLPVVLVLAWAFEVTRDGIRRTQPIHPDEATVMHYIHHLEVVILGTLLIIIAYFVWSERLGEELPRPEAVQSQTGTPQGGDHKDPAPMRPSAAPR